MKKESSQSKTIQSVNKQKIMVCPHCGHEDFERKEGFSLLGQQFVCAKCKGTFRKANLIRAKKTNVEIEKRGSAYKGRGKKSGRRR